MVGFFFFKILFLLLMVLVVVVLAVAGGRGVYVSFLDNGIYYFIVGVILF